jgi:hypothetical protein
VLYSQTSSDPGQIKMQHKHFNTLLNNLKIASNDSSHPSTPLAYSHKHLTDAFYPSDDREKTRVTRDDKTGTVTECVKKLRLGDLNIYSPKRAADWRISVNLEIPGTTSLRCLVTWSESRQ